MCGRYALRAPAEVLRASFELGTTPDHRARYNIAPTQAIGIVRAGDSGSREWVAVRWGLVPSWSKGPDTRYSMINARAETVAEKPSFRSAYRSRRCLIPADGFYEWQRTGEHRQPYFIHRQDHAVFAFAGLWEQWKPNDADAPLLSCTILTVAANTLMAPIHDRMPVILARSRWNAWLSPQTPGSEVATLLHADGDMGEWATTPVSTRVNNPRNNDAAVLAPSGGET